MIIPLDGMIIPLDGMIIPLDGMIIPLDGMIIPLDGMIIPLDGMIIPLDGMITWYYSIGQYDIRRMEPVLNNLMMKFQYLGCRDETTHKNICGHKKMYVE